MVAELVAKLVIELFDLLSLFSKIKDSLLDEISLRPVISKASFNH
jgi:hypothetical protein